MKIFIKRICTFILLVGITQFAFEARAADPVYFVDIQKVISDSISGKAAKSDLDAEVKKREGQLGKLQNDLKVMKEELDKQSSVLSKEALQTKQQAFIQKDKEFQSAYQESRESLGKKNNEALSKIVKQIDEIVASLAKDKGYKIVIEKDPRFVIYSNEDFDLSETITKMLDAKKLGS